MAEPIAKFKVGWKSNKGIDTTQDIMIASAIAIFFRLLSATRITIAVSIPPNANIDTTIHVITQKPENQPCVRM